METIKKALHAEVEDKDELTSGDELAEKKEIPLNDSKFIINFLLIYHSLICILFY
jgi:hypothetical protein